MDLLIDSSAIIAAERSAVALGELTDDATSVAISAITVAELWKGVERADQAFRRSRRAAFCERIFATVDIIAVDHNVALTAARLWSDLERAGTPLAAFDLLLAATALTHGRTLATIDRDFDVVPALRTATLK